MRVNRVQIILVAAAALLTIVLLFANTTPPAKPGAEQAPLPSDHTVHSSDDHVNAALATLGPDQGERIKSFQQRSAADPSSFDSLVKLWDEYKKPDIAAIYAEKAAEKKKTKDAWSYAGQRYYSATGFVGENERGELYISAIRCFTKAQELDPSDLSIKTSLAACYVEGTADPMKGITMLREVVQTDSSNVSAQLQLAFFSVKSNQLDKAIMRFKKVLELDPLNIEVYLYLADVYERTGDKDSAVAALEKYKNLVTDITVKTEVQGYIDKLKKQ
jgi:tetratricopeptide (TPR) repeat protein